MSIAGWERREMLDRYTQVTKSERAAAEARLLDLGDF
jgi:integrase/recombinase XerD